MKRNAVAWAALVVSTAALVSSHGLMKPVPAAPNIPAEGQKTARALSEAFESVADFVKPSVVQISVHRKGGVQLRRGGRIPMPGPGERGLPKDFEEMLKKFFEQEGGVPQHEQFGRGVEGTGSGFVYDDKGHILTNSHVVANAEKITVTFHDGIEANATVVGTDKAADVAVIKVDPSNYRPMLKGQSKNLKVGEWVLAVGSPFGLDQTVTAGIVSATDRNDVGINAYEAFIQTDASINPGNSGGPLVDMNGRVVGINSAIITPSQSNAGVGFAIPIDMAANLADKLIKDGKISRARLGLKFTPLTPALSRQLGLDAQTKGLLVDNIVSGSPAEKAGLKEGDVIVGYDHNKVYNGSVLRNAVATSDVGKSYDLTYLREGHERKTSVTPAPEEKVHFAFEDENRAEPKKESEPAKAETKVEDFGLTVQPLTPELASQFGYPKSTEGLVVTDVKSGSPAEAAGLESGHLITKMIKDKKIEPIKSAKAFQELASHNSELALYVQTAPDSPGQFVTLAKAAK